MWMPVGAKLWLSYDKSTEMDTYVTHKTSQNIRKQQFKLSLDIWKKNTTSHVLFSHLLSLFTVNEISWSFPASWLQRFTMAQVNVKLLTSFAVCLHQPRTQSAWKMCSLTDLCPAMHTHVFRAENTTYTRAYCKQNSFHSHYLLLCVLLLKLHCQEKCIQKNNGSSVGYLTLPTLDMVCAWLSLFISTQFSTHLHTHPHTTLTVLHWDVGVCCIWSHQCCV